VPHSWRYFSARKHNYFLVVLHGLFVSSATLRSKMGRGGGPCYAPNPRSASLFLFVYLYWDIGRLFLWVALTMPVCSLMWTVFPAACTLLTFRYLCDQNMFFMVFLWKECKYQWTMILILFCLILYTGDICCTVSFARWTYRCVCCNSPIKAQC
jgi:hypothetical protein